MSDNVQFVKKENKIPPEYTEVKLSSVGKLSLPTSIHVRNYSGQDTLDLALANENNRLSTILYVLKQCIYEDIEDIEMIHYDELEEIMFNIYSIFWQQELNKIDYPFTPEEVEEAVEKELITREKADNILSGKDKVTATILIKDIKTTPLMEEFKEPFYLTVENQKVGMRLPRVKDFIDAGKITDEKFAFQIQKFYEITSLVNAGRAYEASQKDGYMEYLAYIENYNSEYATLKQSALLLSLNGKPLETWEDKIQAYKDIDLRVWAAYSNKVLKNYKFGINDLVKVKSPLTKNKIERRFQFRLFDYFPDIESGGNTDVSLQFGD